MIQRVKGTDPTDRLGGQGASGAVLADELQTPARRRSTARMIEGAVDRLPTVTEDPDFWAPVIAALAANARNTADARGSAACARVLATLRAQQLDAIALLDKIQRLDGGQATDTVVVVSPPRRFDPS